MSRAYVVLAIGIFLYAGLTHASDCTEHDKIICDFVEKMSLEELLGQTLMVGYVADPDPKSENKIKQARDSNKGLLDLIDKYKVGAIILFKDNFESNFFDREKKDEFAWKTIHDLTTKLQYKSFAAGHEHRQIPLIIAIDQEGGARVRLEKNVTRIPDPMHIGATRKTQRAFEAGSVIGSEMRMLGINTVLTPVADINNNDLKDVIGKRAFGAHPDVVAQFAVQFMLGLQSSGVLSFAKHFPGHGDAEEDPHFHLPKVKYAEESRLTGWDLKPFDALIKKQVNGVVTAHLLTPLEENIPVTISRNTVEGRLRNKMAFQGIILTDDMADMAGIQVFDKNTQQTRERPSTAIAALDAGHDMLMFAYVRPRDNADHPERTLTTDEFQNIYDALFQYYKDPGKRTALEEKVVRIIKQKSHLIPFEGFSKKSSWVNPLNPKEMTALQRRNAAIAQKIFSESVVLISEKGDFINHIGKSNYFKNGKGPLSQDSIFANTSGEILLVTPVVAVDDLTPAIKDHPYWRVHRHTPLKVTTVPLVYGWSKSKIKQAEDHWRKQTGEAVLVENYVRKLGDGSIKYETEAIARKASEIYEKAKDKPLVIFGIVLPEHVKILQQLLAKTFQGPHPNIIVLAYTEPYLLPLEIYSNKNVSVISLSEWPNVQLTADALIGYGITVRDISHMPFSLPPSITRNTEISYPLGNGDEKRVIVDERPLNAIDPEKNGIRPESIKPPDEAYARPTLLNALFATLAGICGGFAFFIFPRRRLRWATELKSQYNPKDFFWSLIFGGFAGALVYGLAAGIQSIKVGPLSLGTLNAPTVLYSVIIIAGWAAPTAWLHFILGLPKK